MPNVNYLNESFKYIYINQKEQDMEFVLFIKMKIIYEIFMYHYFIKKLKCDKIKLCKYFPTFYKCE